MSDKPRECRNCQAPLPADFPKNRRYCTEKCKKDFNTRFNATPVTGPDGTPAPVGPRSVPQYVKDARALAERKLRDMTTLDDEVREVMRDEIRKHITEQVKDKVLGATDLMAAMLPLAMARLFEDLESQDWARYSRASAIVMRYTMLLAAQDGSDTDLGKITVVHQIPGQGDPQEFELPDTPLGHAVKEHVERKQLTAKAMSGDDVYDPDLPEPFEADWPTCYVCKHRQHPDNTRAVDGDRVICSTCRHRRDMELSDARDPLAGPDGVLYFPPAPE